MWEDQEGLARRRAVEIKHGRISMMAFLGMMVQELGITFPGSLTLDGSVQFSDILKDGMGFPALANVPTFGLAQILLFGGIAETVAMPASEYTGGPQNLPGGFCRRRSFFVGIFGASTSAACEFFLTLSSSTRASRRHHE